MSEDADDWARVLAGDGEAFGLIFDRRKNQVRRQVRRLLDRNADVEDALAVVFLEAWRRRTDVRLVDGSLLPWLLATALNVARNSRRSSRRYEGLLLRLPDPATAPDPAAALDDQDVIRALRALPLHDQQVLTLCVLENWSERDTATALGIAAGTVKSRLHRAKRKLAQQLQSSTSFETRTGARNGI